MKIGYYYGHFEKVSASNTVLLPSVILLWNTGTGEQYLYVVHCVHLLVHINL